MKTIRHILWKKLTLRPVSPHLLIVTFFVLWPKVALSMDLETSQIKALAEQGNADGQFALGSRYYEGEGVSQDYAESVKWLRKAAEQGNADAQGLLGNAYYFGEGVSKDSAEAVRWWRKAAEQGSLVAQLGLGKSYYSGDGIPQDHTAAATWWRKAAEQGNPGAQFLLGTCYQNGSGVSQDFAQAYIWYAVAARNKQDNAATYRNEMLKILSRQQLAKANAALIQLIDQLDTHSASKD